MVQPALTPSDELACAHQPAQLMLHAVLHAACLLQTQDPSMPGTKVAPHLESAVHAMRRCGMQVGGNQERGAAAGGRPGHSVLGAARQPRHRLDQ